MIGLKAKCARGRGCANCCFPGVKKVQDRQGLAEAAGLKPVVVDIESHASWLAAGRLIEDTWLKVDALVALFEVGALTEHAGHSK